MESLLFHLGMTAVALEACGVFVMLIAACSAPMGYQDEAGFHYGVDPRSAGTTEPAPVAVAPNLWYPLWGAF